MARKSGFGDTQVRRHKINDWESYEVKKEELDSLENGCQSDKLLEFGIATSSSFVSFFIAWCSVDYGNQTKLYHIYLIIWISLLIASIVLLCLWWHGRRNKNNIFETIKNRPLDD